MAAQPATEALPVLIALPGEIDISNADAVRHQICTAAVRPGVTAVIADMTVTTFCDCAGAGMLMRAHIEAAASGTELRLLTPARPVMRLLELAGLDQVLAIYDSLDEALMPPPPATAW
jgi:anti-anti-sigma factor